jgi:hypothetical protein
LGSRHRRLRRLPQAIEALQNISREVPTRENAAHQKFFSTLIRRQIVEKWCRYGGWIESDSVVRDPFREEQLLQSLLVVERGLYPQV